MHAADRDAARGRIDLIVEEIDRSLMRITVFVLQSDFDRKLSPFDTA